MKMTIIMNMMIMEVMIIMTKYIININDNDDD